MGPTDAAIPLTGTSSPARRPLSPLARGIGYRLAWAAGLSAALWLAVVWALT